MARDDVGGEAGAPEAGRRWGGRPGLRRVVQGVVVAGPVVAMLVAGWQLRWMSDDGFIHLRVVSQLVHGNGPVFNAGERVEASTSPLWVALLALAYPVTALALPWKAVVLGIGLTAGGVFAAERAAVRLAPAGGTIVLPVGAVVVVALPPFWEFATSGLETGLVFAWLGTCCWWSARRSTGEAPVWWAELAGGALVGVGPLIRPDLLPFTLAFGLVLLAALWRRGWSSRLAFAAAVAALPVAYQVFRMGYYAMVVPNTAVAKEAGDAHWAQGRRYLSDLVDPYRLWVPVALLGLVLAAQTVTDVRSRAWRRTGARLAPVAAAIVQALYVTRLGGDFMHARLLLPAVFALAAPVGIGTGVGLARGISGRRLVGWRTVGPVLAAGVCAWALVCAVALRRDVRSPAPWGGMQPVSADGTIAEERDFYRTIRHLDVPVRLDESLGEQLEDDVRTWPRTGLAYVGETNEPVLERLPLSSHVDARAAQSAMSIGASSMAWGDDVYVIDVLSLAHPVGSHLDHVVGRRPGHQKPLPLVWRTAGVVEGQLPVRLADDAGTIVLSRRDVAAADHARRCGQLGRYLGGIHGSLTPARFLTNLVHALPNTTLRVPTDPRTAESRLCTDDDGDHHGDGGSG
jgi:arabinofuranosyltransferase